MIETIKEEIGNKDIKIIATGGLSSLIIPLCKSKIELNQDLTMLGLLEIYNKNI